MKVAASVCLTDDIADAPREDWVPAVAQLASRIAASSSMMAGLKFCVVALNSYIGTPSARSRCDICADCQGSYPTLATWKLLHSCRTSVSNVEVRLVAGRHHYYKWPMAASWGKEDCGVSATAASFR
jgi:hypothetical protein